MDRIDIGLFDFDWHHSIYFFIVSPDEQIYLRYGGRDAASADSYLHLDSFKLALRAGLEEHERWLAGALPARPRPPPFFARELERLRVQELQRGRCVECHMIGDYRAAAREREGTLDKRREMFRSPNIRDLGIHLDVPKGLAVKLAEGAALTAGLLPGDLIVNFGGQRVLTFGDLLYVYDGLDRTATRLPLTVERAGAGPVDLVIELPPQWWVSDITYRYWSIDPQTHLTTAPLTDASKARPGLRSRGFRLRGHPRQPPRGRAQAPRPPARRRHLLRGRGRSGPVGLGLSRLSAAERLRRGRGGPRGASRRRPHPDDRPDPPPALPQARSPLNDQPGSAIRAPRISRMSPGRVRQQPPIAVAPSRRHSRASSGRSAVSGGISQTFRTGSQRPSPFG